MELNLAHAGPHSAFPTAYDTGSIFNIKGKTGDYIVKSDSSDNSSIKKTPFKPELLFFSITLTRHLLNCVLSFEDIRSSI